MTVNSFDRWQKNGLLNVSHLFFVHIVLVGWAIYPIGYIAGVLMEGAVAAESLNVVYNLADFVNKILFGLIIWNLAVKDSSETSH